VTIRLARVYDSATAICAKTLIIYFNMTASATSVLKADVFGSGLLHWYLLGLVSFTDIFWVWSPSLISFGSGLLH